jgi:hypothetical protein
MHRNLTMIAKRVSNLDVQMNLYILADACLPGRGKELQSFHVWHVDT